MDFFFLEGNIFLLFKKLISKSKQKINFVLNFQPLKGDSPRYLDVPDEQLETYSLAGQKTVQHQNRQYNVSAHVKMCKVTTSVNYGKR